MKRLPFRYTTTLANRVLLQMARGHSLALVCAEPGADITGNTKLPRPSRYTAALADQILDAVAAGRTLAVICKQPGGIRRRGPQNFGA